MTKIEVNPATFIATGKNERGMEVGTVEVNGVARKAVRSDSGTIYLHGYVGRYKTSANPWNATVYLNERGLQVFFGRDDRSGRFNKRNAISFEPATFDAQSGPGYWDAA